MSPRRSKFQPPPPTSRRSQIVRNLITTPYLGMNASQSPREMQPNESPFIRDFRVTDLGLAPRSVNSRIGFVGITDAVQHLAQHEETLIGVSTSSLLWTRDITSLFSMSWSSNGGGPIPDLSATASGSTQRFGTASAKDSIFGNTLFITGVDQMVPQLLPLDNSSSHSTLTDWLSSGESFAYDCDAFDERLVMWGSIDSLGTQNPTRAKWSVRGDPDNFTGNGSGFQDLVEMDGTASRIVHTRDRQLLFTERDVWEATPRRDSAAFDFRPIFNGIGLAASRALVNTPFGIFWYGTDRKLHRYFGNRVTLIGRKIWQFYEGGINDVQFHPDVVSGLLTLNDVETNKHAIVSSGLLNIDDAVGQNLFVDDGTGKFLVHDASVTGTEDPDFARNALLTYNPVQQELVLWFGVTSAGKQAATAAALRLDTLTETGQMEEDGIWTSYLHDTTNAILSATPFTDSNGINHMLYGSNLHPDNASGEIWEWTDNDTTEFVGNSVRTIGEDWQPVWHSPSIRGSRDIFASESHTGLWIAVDLPEHDQSNIIGASYGSQVWNLASPSPSLNTASFGTTQVGGEDSDASGRQISPTIAFIPTTTRAEPETSIQLSVISGRPTINRVELESRAFSGRFRG